MKAKEGSPKEPSGTLGSFLIQEKNDRKRWKCP